MQAPSESAFTLLSICSTMHKQKKGHSIEVSFSCDSRGIQTHNLLIRSQMLYSVELGSLAFVLRLQRYDYFPEPPNFFLIFFKKNSFLAIFHDILFIYPAFL